MKLIFFPLFSHACTSFWNFSNEHSRPIDPVFSRANTHLVYSCLTYRLEMFPSLMFLCFFLIAMLVSERTSRGRTSAELAVQLSIILYLKTVSDILLTLILGKRHRLKNKEKCSNSENTQIYKYVC